MLRILSCAILALTLCAGTARGAEVDLDLTFGLSDERQDSTNQFSFGALVTMGEANWWLKPEVGLQRKTYPVFGGLDREFTIGAVRTWKFDRHRFYLGAGYAHANFQQGANEGSSSGPFARVGIMWPIAGGRFSMGVDGKVAWLRPWHPFGVQFEAAYSQLALRMGWRL